MKEKGFVKDITDKKNKETFGNGTRSIINNYNVTDENIASSMAHTKLRKVEIIEAIEKKILKKEELQAKQTSLVEKIEQAIEKSGYTVENTPLINQLGINIERNAKLNGDLIDRIQSINVHIDRDKDLSTLSVESLQSEVMRRMQSTGHTDV